MTEEQTTGRRVKETSLGSRAAGGAMITVGAQVFKIIVQVAGVVVLARLLTPGDYGLVAMVAAVIGVAEIFREFGLSAAAVQAKTLSPQQRDNLFWINTGAGAVLMVAIIAAAPLIAWWYHRPELVDLARGLSPVFLINGMTTQYRADLNRRMKFARLAIAEISAPIVALSLAIVLAVAGAGFWALVAQQLTTAVILLLVTALSGRWLPRLYDRLAPMGELLTFGWHLAGSQLVGYLANNVDSITIGTRFGATPLGLYNRAFQLLMTPLGQLRAPTTTVALPVLSRLQSDQDGTDRFIQRGQLALGLTMVAGLGLVIGAAEPITAVFLGDQWGQVEPILRLLAAAGIFQTLAYVGYWIYLAHGLTKQLLHYTFLTATIKIICVLVGSQWGLIGVAWGYAIAPALAWPMSFWWLSRTSTVRVRPLFAGAARIIALTAAIAASSWTACLFTAQFGRWWELAAGVGGALACYGLALLVPIYRRDITGIIQIAKEGLSGR